MNQRQYLEAKRLLKEFRLRYRRLVRCSLRTVFRATAPPPAHPALSEGQPKFGRFLEIDPLLFLGQRLLFSPPSLRAERLQWGMQADCLLGTQWPRGCTRCW